MNQRDPESEIYDLSTPNNNFYKEVGVGVTGVSPSCHGVYMEEISSAYYRLQHGTPKV